MRTELLRRGARTAAVAALALATSLGGMATADAKGRGHHDHAPKPLNVRIGASGIDAPTQGVAGLVSFHVETDDPGGRFVEAFRPHAGVSVDQVIADLAKAVSMTSPPTAAAGISAVRDEADAFGGAMVTPDVSETFTTKVSEGTVFLLDFGAFLKDQTHPVLTSLELCDGPDGDLARFPDSVVIQHNDAAGQPRFAVHDLTMASDSILVRNNADELHEMQLQPVVPGTTDAQVQAFFDAIAAGKPPAGPPPFTGPALGLGPISPDRTVLLETHHLPPGTYVLLCFVPDDTSGIPHAFLGMHQVVVLS